MKMMVCVENFVADIDGTLFYGEQEKTRVDESHPVVKRMPRHFKPLEETYPVESATAAPGEKRAAPRVSKKKTATEGADEA